MLRYILLSLLIFASSAQARPWPSTFSRKTYHTFYIESKVVDNMPFNIQGFNYEAGKPAVLNFITVYTQFGLHPQNIIDPPRYLPAFICNLKGNVPVYDGWTFIIATTSKQIRSCN